MSYTSILQDEKREKAANYEIWRNEQKQIKKDEAAELKRQRDEKLNERMKSGKIQEPPKSTTPIISTDGATLIHMGHVFTRN